MKFSAILMPMGALALIFIFSNMLKVMRKKCLLIQS
nr:MAG TPA: hypothetical protein [Caudoviricetes sp.]